MYKYLLLKILKASYTCIGNYANLQYLATENITGMTGILEVEIFSGVVQMHGTIKAKGFTKCAFLISYIT